MVIDASVMHFFSVMGQVSELICCGREEKVEPFRIEPVSHYNPKEWLHNNQI
jgi:hypothetical protein